MTGTTAEQVRPHTELRRRHLAVALTVGVALGSVATLGLSGGADAPATDAPGALQPDVVADRVATTTGTEQYVGWYTRPIEGAAAWKSATRQYVDWYLRDH